MQPLPTKLVLRKKRAREGKSNDEVEHFPVPSRVTVRRRKTVAAIELKEEGVMKPQVYSSFGFFLSTWPFLLQLIMTSVDPCRVMQQLRRGVSQVQGEQEPMTKMLLVNNRTICMMVIRINLVELSMICLTD